MATRLTHRRSLTTTAATSSRDETSIRGARPMRGILIGLLLSLPLWLALLGIVWFVISRFS